MDLIGIDKTFHPNRKEHTFLSASHETFSKTEHKENLNRNNKIEITPYILSNHHGLNLEFNHKLNYRKHSHSWKLKKLKVT